MIIGNVIVCVSLVFAHHNHQYSSQIKRIRIFCYSLLLPQFFGTTSILPMFVLNTESKIFLQGR